MMHAYFCPEYYHAAIYISVLFAASGRVADPVILPLLIGNFSYRKYQRCI